MVSELSIEDDRLDALLDKLPIEDTDDGPGLEYTSPEQRRKTANQVAKTKTNKLHITKMENSTFDFDDLPGIARVLIPCMES